MVSRQPQQIVGFDVALDKSSKRIQQIIDTAPKAKFYCTDGYNGYIDVIYPGKHIRNVHTVEGVNADLRHHIPILARRSRCFPRKLETLKAFVNAYNSFGLAKYKYRQSHKTGELPFSVIDFL